MNAIIIFAIAVTIAAVLSARWNWWRPAKSGIAVLMYHKVGIPPAGSQLKKLWVDPDMFRRQMQYLKDRGYTPILFKDVYSYWDKQTPLPEKAVLITFDDGYANNFELAAPILKEFGFPATLFVVVQTVGWDNKWHDPTSETRIPMVSWAQLKELRAAGWEIGSHTMNHPNLQKTELKTISIEMEKSRSVIAEFLGESPDTFAYPYGSGEDQEVIRNKAKDAGYRVAVGVHPGKWTVDRFRASPFNLPRVFVRGGENMFDFHLQMRSGKSRF